MNTGSSAPFSGREPGPPLRFPCYDGALTIFSFVKRDGGSLTYLLDNSPKRRNKEINSEAELLHIYLQDCIIKPLLFFCPYIKAQDEMALSGKWFPFCFVQIYSFLFSLFK